MDIRTLFAKHCNIKNKEEPYNNGLDINSFEDAINEFSVEYKKIIMENLLLKRNKDTIKHLAKRKIEDCKFSAYESYTAGNDGEGDFGRWEDWENVLNDFCTEIIERIIKS